MTPDGGVPAVVCEPVEIRGGLQSQRNGQVDQLAGVLLPDQETVEMSQRRMESALDEEQPCRRRRRRRRRDEIGNVQLAELRVRWAGRPPTSSSPI